MVFIKTLEQTSILLIFIFTGYFLRKKEVINESGKKVLAGLLVNLFSPCYAIASLSSQLSIERINEYLTYLLAGTVLAVVIIFVAIPIARILGKDKLEKNILKYALAFANIGYFGYPVVGAVFGEPVKASMILFCIPQSIAINTYGYQVLTSKVVETPKDLENTMENSKKKFNWKENFRFLHSVPFIGTMLGVVLGLLPITMPEYVINLLNLAGNCQSATAMLLTGAVLAGVPFLKLFTSWKPYVIGFIRLLLIPAILGVLMYLFGLRGELFIICMACISIPVGMNVVVYPESAGLDGTSGAKMCFISYVLAVVTLPIVFEIVKILA
ncbi:MAG: AEC family transporter [Clostridia bacterium]|nr:AEC family transporter [Clostridia bacterium]